MQSVGTNFVPMAFVGKIDSVFVDGIKTTAYDFDSIENILTINDTKLMPNSTVVLKIINNSFYLSDVQSSAITTVMINDIKTTNYTFISGVLTIADNLQVGVQYRLK